MAVVNKSRHGRVRFRTLFLLAGILSVCGLMALSGKSHADSIRGVLGSMHDLSINGPDANYSYQTQEICVFCHTPHRAVNNGPAGVALDTTFSSQGVWNSGSMDKHMLLWNRSLSNAASFTPYTSASAFTNNTNPSLRIYSLLCLSCHDGVGAMNVLTTYPADGVRGGTYGGLLEKNSGVDTIGGIANIGECTPGQPQCVLNLSNDHPVSMDYTATVSSPDPEFVPIENVTSKVKFYPSPTFSWNYVAGDRTSIECSTCHDVHNEGNASDVNGTYPFLRDTMNKSQLCEDCHLK